MQQPLLITGSWLQPIYLACRYLATNLKSSFSQSPVCITTSNLYFSSCTGSLPFSAYLIYMVDIRSFIRPVVVALLHSVFCQWCQHDDDDAATLPHHLHMKKKNTYPSNTSGDNKFPHTHPWEIQIALICSWSERPAFQTQVVYWSGIDFLIFVEEVWINVTSVCVTNDKRRVEQQEGASFRPLSVVWARSQHPLHRCSISSYHNLMCPWKEIEAHWQPLGKWGGNAAFMIAIKTQWPWLYTNHKLLWSGPVDTLRADCANCANCARMWWD